MHMRQRRATRAAWLLLLLLSGAAQLAAGLTPCRRLASSACSARADCLPLDCNDDNTYLMSPSDPPVSGANCPLYGYDLDNTTDVCSNWQLCGRRGAYECTTDADGRPRRLGCAVGFSCADRFVTTVCADAQGADACMLTDKPMACSFDRATDTCFASLPYCANIASDACQRRSDCVYGPDGRCTSGASACGRASSRSACPSSCYWDALGPLAHADGGASLTPNTANGTDVLYAGQCVNSIAEITDAIAFSVAGVESDATTGDYRCAHWSPYPLDFSGADACLRHGCTRRLETSDACVPQASAPVLGSECAQLYDMSYTDRTACSLVPEFCAFDTPFGPGVCRNGLPATCEQLFSNQWACGAFGARGTCAFNLLTQRCWTPTCSLLSSSTCGARPACVLAGSCGSSSSACASVSGAPACAAAGCYLDPFSPMPHAYDSNWNVQDSNSNSSSWFVLTSGVNTDGGQCFDSLAEVAGNAFMALLSGTTPVSGAYPCSAWSGLADTLDASDICRAHGCRRIGGSLECGEFSASNMPTGPLCGLLPDAMQYDADQCMQLAGYCNWDSARGICLNGPSDKCQYKTTADDCAAVLPRLSCTFEPTTAVCFVSVPLCGGLDASTCAARSDCSYDGSVCRDQLSACRGATSTAECDVGCYWDAFGPLGVASNASMATPSDVRADGTLVHAGQCVNSMSEITDAIADVVAGVASPATSGVYACSHWTAYPIDLGGFDACFRHGCLRASETDRTCAAPDYAPVLGEACTQMFSASYGDRAVCGNLTDFCVFDTSSQHACVNGAPTTCEQLYSNEWACGRFGAQGTCSFNTRTQRCGGLPAACGSLDVGACAARSDCDIAPDGSCFVQTQAHSCIMQSPDACGAACFSDPFSPMPQYYDAMGSVDASPSSLSVLTSGVSRYGHQCFNSVDEVAGNAFMALLQYPHTPMAAGIFPCSAWSGLPDALDGSDICRAHGCRRVAGSPECAEYSLRHRPAGPLCAQLPAALQGQPAACATVASYCHWDPASGECLNMPFDFCRAATGENDCRTEGPGFACTYDPYAQTCYRSLPQCRTLTPDTCKSRSDCTMRTSDGRIDIVCRTMSSVPDVPFSPCFVARASTGDMRRCAPGCFWDVFAPLAADAQGPFRVAKADNMALSGGRFGLDGQCVDGLAEITDMIANAVAGVASPATVGSYMCDHWSQWPINTAGFDACFNHGCVRASLTNSTCTLPASAPVLGQPCAQLFALSLADRAACGNVAQFCSTDSAGMCMNGRPTKCEQFYGNQRECFLFGNANQQTGQVSGSQLTCAFNQLTLRCATAPRSCSDIGSREDACNRRSDCYFEAGYVNYATGCMARAICGGFNAACEPATAYCAETFDEAGCLAQSCSWDAFSPLPYYSPVFVPGRQDTTARDSNTGFLPFSSGEGVGQCFNSRAEVAGNAFVASLTGALVVRGTFPCSQWSGLADTLDAGDMCRAHGCRRTLNSTECGEYSAGAPPAGPLCALLSASNQHSATECAGVFSYCHWDEPSSTCLNLPADRCSGIATASGCSAVAPMFNCTFDSYASSCFESLASCPSLQKAQCSARSDCVYGPNRFCSRRFNACGRATTTETCPSSCYWDALGPLGAANGTDMVTPNAPGAYAGQCVNGMAEITDAIANAVAGIASPATSGDYQCAHWTAFPVELTGLDACLKRGCARASRTDRTCTPRADAPVAGLTCTQLFDATDGIACGNVAEFCAFDVAAGVCLNGLPTSCEQLYNNQWACGRFGAQGTCAFNVNTRRCFAAPPACASLGAAECARRSDCSFAFVCTASQMGAAQGAICSADACRYEPFGPMPYYQTPGLYPSDLAVLSSGGSGQYFYSLLEVAGNTFVWLLLPATPRVSGTFACSTWSGLADTLDASDACRSHGCQRTDSSVECAEYSQDNMPTGPLCALLPAQKQNDTTQCYALNAYCHWSWTAKACLNAPPAMCEEFVGDAAGCAAFGAPDALSCGWNLSNGRCFTAPLCASAKSNATCDARVDCRWIDAASGCVSRVSSTDLAVYSLCGSLGQDACEDTNNMQTGTACFWDPHLTVPTYYAPSAFSFGLPGSASDSRSLMHAGSNRTGVPYGMCYNNLLEVVSEYACAHWQDYPEPNTACQFHYCALQRDGACTSTNATLPVARPSASRCRRAADAAACAATLPLNVCTYDAAVSSCFGSTMPCALLSAAACLLRSDCSGPASDGAACGSGASACGQSDNVASCPLSCYWDAFAPIGKLVDGALVTPNVFSNASVSFVGQCVNSMAEITNAIANSTAGVASPATAGSYGCAHWTPFPANFTGADACFKHGCARVSATNQTCAPRLVAPVPGQPCAQLFASSRADRAACSNVPEFCAFDASTSMCLNGAPATCDQLLGNQRACGTFGAQGTCTFNLMTQRCTAAPTACRLIELSGACSGRSDCTFNATDGVCADSATGCTTLASAARTPAAIDACSAQMCHYEPFMPSPRYLTRLADASVRLTPNTVAPTNASVLVSGTGFGQCFNSLAEVAGNAFISLLSNATLVNGTFACSTWSGLPDTLDASDMCRSHGCRRIHGSFECGDFSRANMPPGPLCGLLPNTTQSDMAQCFALNGYCHWDLFSAACLNLPPATCEQFTNDAAGCASFNGTAFVARSGSCGWNVDNGQCFTLASCSYVATPELCSTRVDCSWLDGSCSSVNQSASLGGCGAKLQADCGANNTCVWDPYLTVPAFYTASPFSIGIGGSTSDSTHLMAAGVNSMQTPDGMCVSGTTEVNAEYACEHWQSYFANPGAACLFHACALNNGRCTSASLDSTLIAAPVYSVQAKIEFAIVNTSMSATTFTANVVIPVASLWQPATPVRYVIAIGVASDIMAAPAAFLTPGACTSVGDNTTSLASSFDGSARIDQQALRREFYASIGTGNFGAPGGQPESASVAAVIGRWNIGSVNLVRSVSLSTFQGATGQTNAVSFAISVDMNSNCVARGTTYNTDGSKLATVTTVSVSVLQLSSSNTIGAMRQFSLELRAHGSVSTSQSSSVSSTATMPSSEDAAFVFSSDGSMTPVPCAAGSKARHWTIKITFANYDSSATVGVQNITDVSMPMMGGSINCFGTMPVKVAPTLCADFQCATIITFQTRCVPVVPSGDSFSTCWGIGTIIGAGQGSARGVQSFSSIARSWTAGQSVGTPLHADANGAPIPDVVSVTINFPTLADAQAVYVLRAQLGLLAAPDVLDVSDKTKYMLAGPDGLSPSPAYLNDNFTPVVSLTDALGRNSFTLSIDTSTIVVTPLSLAKAVDGSYMNAGHSTLNWTQLAHAAARTTRTAQAACAASGCALLDVVQASRYMDGFSVPVMVLRALMPASGYRISVGWVATMAGGSAGRRLMAVGDLLPQSQRGTLAVSFVVQQAATEAADAHGPDTACMTRIESSVRRASNRSFWISTCAASLAYGATLLLTYAAHARST